MKLLSVLLLLFGLLPALVSGASYVSYSDNACMTPATGSGSTGSGIAIGSCYAIPGGGGGGLAAIVINPCVVNGAFNATLFSTVGCNAGTSLGVVQGTDKHCAITGTGSVLISCNSAVSLAMKSPLLWVVMIITALLVKK